jgi:HlyD family secretion protein
MREAVLALLCLPLLHAQDPATQEPPAAFARVQPLRSLVVRARLDATVSRLFVQVGDPVKALGQLVMLSAPDLTTELGHADQDLFTAEKELDLVAADERIARLRLGIALRKSKTAELSLAAEKAAVDVAGRMLEDIKRRFDAGASSSDDVLKAEMTVQKRNSEVRSAEAAVLDLRDEAAIAEQQLQRADGAVKVQRARIDSARAVREVLRVRSEMADVKNLLPGARVTRLFVGQGDLVGPGTPLLELCDDSKVVLQVFIPGPLVARVRAGTLITVRAADGAPSDLQVKLTRISGVLDPETQTMLAEVELENPEGRWVPGLQLPVTVAEGAGR